MSSLRKESPALARAVSNRRRQRTSAAAAATNTATYSTNGSLSSTSQSSHAAPSLSVDHIGSSLLQRPPFISPPSSASVHREESRGEATVSSSESSIKAASESKPTQRRESLGPAQRTTAMTTTAVSTLQPQETQKQRKTSPPVQQRAVLARDPPASSSHSSVGSHRSTTNKENPKSATPANRVLPTPNPTPSTKQQHQTAPHTTTSINSSTTHRNPGVVSKSHAHTVYLRPGSDSSGQVICNTADETQSKSVSASARKEIKPDRSMNGVASSSTLSSNLKSTMDEPTTTVNALINARDATKSNGTRHELLQRSSALEVSEQQSQKEAESNSPRTLRYSHFDNRQDEEVDENDANVDDNVDVDEDVLDVESSDGMELADATCLTSGTLISIRSAGSSAGYVLVHSEGETPGVASLRGMGLGRDIEIFRLQTTTKYNGGSEQDFGDNLLRFGDTLTLTCLAARDRALGVRVLKQQNYNGNTTGNRSHCYQVGCWGTSLGLDVEWTILAASQRQQPLWVGPAALRTRPRRFRRTMLVRAGDYVVLRHCATGGLLSLAVDTNGNVDQSTLSTLTLVTDSYYAAPAGQQREQNGAHHIEDSLLSRLQRHDHMFPTLSETFQLIPTTSPPCPRWARHGLSFYSGSYLLLPERNDSEGIDPLNSLSSDKAFQASSQNAAATTSVQNQEIILLDEVIGSLVGLEGKHVRIRSPTGTPSAYAMEFQLLDSQNVIFHLSLRRLVERILPLSTAFIQVHAFVVRHSTESVFGSVMQALCEAMDTPLRNHVSFVNNHLDQQFRQELLHGNVAESQSLLTMKQLFNVVQPALQTMLALQAVCIRIRDKKGGCLLNEINRLRSQMFAGDFNSQRLLESLLDMASVPYMELLRSWLQTGMLDDPYAEFLVEKVLVEGGAEQSTLEPGYNGDTWNQIYIIRKEHVLLMDFASSEPTLQKILRTGKYWNAVGAAGRLDESSNTKQDGILELSFRMDSITFLSFVDSMFQSASSALVRLIRNDFNLFESMRTLKRYFLLDQGDFFVNFLDTAEEELSKSASHVSMGQIQHWLGMTIQLCETTGDRILQVPGSRLDKPAASPLTPQLLRCSLASESLSEHLKSLHGQTNCRDSLDSLNQQAYGTTGLGLTGVEAFMIGFPRISFPTSLVISPNAIAGYQLLFRHLFIAKHVERRLVNVWRDQQVMKVFQSLRGALGPSNFLRQRMLHFSQNLIYYMMFEVIEPNWLEMGQGVFGTQGEQTLDSIIDCHKDFLRRTLDACLLTNYDFVRILTKLMTTCLRFADKMKHFVQETGVHEDCKRIANEKRASIARNINAPQGANTKKAIHDALVTAKEERQRLMQDQTDRVRRELCDSTFQKTVARLEHTFSKIVGEFMQLLRSDMGDLYHSHRLNLLIRLDYNGYVTQSIDINTS